MEKISLSSVSKQTFAAIVETLKESSFSKNKFWTIMLMQYAYLIQEDNNVIIFIGNEKLCSIEGKIAPFLPKEICEFNNEYLFKTIYGFIDEVKAYREKLAYYLVD